ncbi:piRNA biogenesis protein EXD1-like [Uloborus diversus]|uniref:piRNA biogenesis protein EXD1-like n=1 Tax=Uloborus diversus TaxID=327109 RepID=UPI002409D6C0|nr:piRNA biogenesis protein EXD1-like [Uloborus diversus]
MFQADSMFEHYDPVKYDFIPCEYSDKLSGNVVFLDSIDSVFEKSIEILKKQNSIGVSFQGNNIGRYQDFNLICMSTSTCNFIFDICYFGKEAFENGIKDILESVTIEKIIHDCREASDALFHRYDTEMENVFDTQVADYIVRSLNSTETETSDNVCTLDECIEHYLNVSKEFLFNRKKYEEEDIDDAYIALRPLDEALKNFSIKNTIYLRLLRQELSNLMYGPYRSAVQLYLNAVAPLPAEEVVLRAVDDDAPPPELLGMFETFILGSE